MDLWILNCTHTMCEYASLLIFMGLFGKQTCSNTRNWANWTGGIFFSFSDYQPLNKKLVLWASSRKIWKTMWGHAYSYCSMMKWLNSMLLWPSTRNKLQSLIYSRTKFWILKEFNPRNWHLISGCHELYSPRACMHRVNLLKKLNCSHVF